MALFPIDINIHAKIFRALQVHFYLVEVSESMDEIVHAFVVSPHQREIVDNKGKTNSAIVVAKHRWGALDWVVAILV